jgi:putative endonuclease
MVVLYNRKGFEAMQYFVYILKCADGTFYTGSTNNLEQRVKHHNEHKSGAKYTAARRPVVLSYYETYETMHDARVRENIIKKLKRQIKEKMVKQFNSQM